MGSSRPMPWKSNSPSEQQLLSSSPLSYHNAPFRSMSHNSPSLHVLRSPSAASEIEVILDDGSVQKRTVSLSTLPDPTTERNISTIQLSEQSNPSERPSDTTPLLNSHHHFSYESLHDYNADTRIHSDGNMSHSSDESAVDDSESSSSSDGSDSDEPFFPARRKSRNRPQRETHNTDASRGATAWICQTFKRALAFSLTEEQRMVLKCSFAYFIGSLFTFVPMLNASIGNNRTSSHLVATATVFFNPAKTLGGMVEAAIYGWGYTLFALTVCLGSMVTTDFLVDCDFVTLAHTISLVVWLAGATFIIAFLKAHWNKPPVATASSLAFIIIFIIVVREGSANRGDFDTTRIEQITSAVAMGTLITVACCVIFWPVSAARKLKKDLEATLGSYRVLLKLLTKTFLLDDDLPEFKANRTLQAAIESHRVSFTALQKSLQEAKLEMMWSDVVREGRAKEYDRVVQSMERLAQYVGGLRSSCGLQFELIRRQDGPKRRQFVSLPGKKRHLKPSASSEEVWNIRAGYRRRKLQEEIRRQRSGYESSPHRAFSASGEEDEDPSRAHGRSGSLPEFVQTIRNPLKSLAYTCKQTIMHLQTHFGASPSVRAQNTMPSFQLLKANLVKAIALFEKSQRKAVQKLQLRTTADTSGSTENACYAPSEDVFLVYFFVFNMTEFAQELISLVECVDRLSQQKQTTAGRYWCCFAWPWWTRRSAEQDKGRLPFQPFVPNDRNMMNTLHTPAPTTRWRSFFVRIWRAFSLFKVQKVRYATKASVAAVLLAIPAFLDETGEIFREWRIEWALITLMVVMTPTVGGTNIVAVYRIFSTILGCYSATYLYLLFPGNMYVLPVVTWLFSIPNFWLILNHKHGKFGQFTLLAYNLVMLNKYNDRDTDEIPVWMLAFQRCAAILLGVVFGLVATAYIWPFEARVELRKGLSDFLLRLGWLYQKLVSVYSDRPETHDTTNIAVPTGTDPSATGMAMTVEEQRRLATQTFMELELGLQRTLLELQALLAQTPNEPRLKGPFPMATYRDVLDSCQNILDKFLSMRTAVLKDAWFDQVQRGFIIPITNERREMVGNVLLYFYLLASALRLKTPLPPYFPPARKAWKSLIVRLRELPVVRSQSLVDNDNVYVFYYAYVTMMEDIIRELDKLGDNMTQLFGSLIPHEQWDRLFEIRDEEDRGAWIPRACQE